MNIQGSCLCKAVRYTSSATEPAMALNCHCDDCKKSTGSPYATIIGVPEAELTLTGELRYYDSIGESGGKVSRGFCPECGSPVLSRVDIVPHLLFIKAGSLDDASGLKLQMELWTDSKMPGIDEAAELLSFPRSPQ